MSSNPFQPPEPGSGSEPFYVYRPLKALTILVGIALTLEVLFLTLGAVSQSRLMSHDPDIFLGSEPKDDTSIALAITMGLAGFLYLVTYLGGAVVFLVWLVRASKNARALGSQGMEFTPGWTAGWFFVPVLNLFRPYAAVSELYQASDPEAGPADWGSFEPPGFVLGWWLSWIAFTVVGTAAQNFWQLPLLTAALCAVAAAMAIRVLIAIQQRQTEKKARGVLRRAPDVLAVPPSNRLL